MDGYHYSSNDGPSDESRSYCNRDYTNVFTTDQIFESREDMLDWVQTIGLQHGFVVVISKSANLKGRTMPKCILGCERGGTYRFGGIFNKILRRNTGTKKCECPFELRGVPIAPDAVRWGVRVLCGIHNHEPAENFEGHEYPSRMKPEERKIVEQLANRTAPREILSILKQRDPSNTTGIKSVYNAIEGHKENKRGGLNSTQYVLDQLINNGYFHDFNTDEYTNEITDIVWAHPTSLELSVNFSSVLIMDATYKTNEYRKPLLEVVGMTSTNLTFSIMFAYLNNEREDRVTWALDTLKMWMDEKRASPPLVCVTDRDLALMNAVEACFPMAHHILCIWHINQAVMKNCSAALGHRFGDFCHSWHSLINSSCTESFERRWDIMRQQYDQHPRVINYLWNTWLHPYKERFITAWTDTYFHIGSNSSQRAESAHSKLKKYLGGSSMSSLQTSFDSIHNMLTIQFGAIKKSFEQSLHIPRHNHLNTPLYKEIRCRISLYALELIEFQYESAADAYPILGGCSYPIRTTHGLPCMHDLRLWVLNSQAIPFSSINPHWTRLSMHADGFNHEGQQPDGISRLVNILEEMEPDMRSHMVSRFVDMADPSRSSIRGPSYNTPHGGRPMGKAEQSGRRSFSCTEGRPKGAKQSGRNSFSVVGTRRQTGRERTENEQDPYIHQLPLRFQGWMSHTIDVAADGHCGFRAIAAHCYGNEKYWTKVRSDLIQEMLANKDLYDVLYPYNNRANELLHALNCFLPQADESHWMDGIGLGLVIASFFNIALYTFDSNVNMCFTHLPLRTPPTPGEQPREIAIARVNNNHFVQLFLIPGHPVPPVIGWWHTHALLEKARGWIYNYEERLHSWCQIVSHSY